MLRTSAPAEGVDGLGVVATTAMRLRVFARPEGAHRSGLHAVGVLILVDHQVAVAFPEERGQPFAPRFGIAAQQVFQLEEQIVVVEQPVPAPVQAR